MSIPDFLSLGRALATILAFVSVALSLVGLVWLGIFYDPVRRSAKNSAMAFLIGPLVVLFGDNDSRKHAVFKRGARVLVPLLIVSSVALVVLTS